MLCCLYKAPVLPHLWDGPGGTLVDDGLMHVARHPPGSHRHSSGHSIATLTSTITNYDRNITEGLPTAATPVPQSVLMAWRRAVICTERERNWHWMLLCWLWGLGGLQYTDNMGVAVNSGPETHFHLTNTHNAHNIYIYTHIQGVTGGTDQTSGECSLC